MQKKKGSKRKQNKKDSTIPRRKKKAVRMSGTNLKDAEKGS
jgi:hypothetical protein